MSCLIYCYVECRYAECRYAECSYAMCRYAECSYAECRGCLKLYQNKLVRFENSERHLELTMGIRAVATAARFATIVSYERKMFMKSVPAGHL